MKETFIEIIDYIKKPTNEKDSNTNYKYRSRKFFLILLICLITSFALSPIILVFEYFEIVDMENHKVEEMLKNMSNLQNFIAISLVAPLFEELLFRAPITAFKKPLFFKIAFYTFTLLFGYVHLTNFDINTNTLLFSFFLVLPQIILGFYLGYIRVKFGLLWAILLHSSYNSIVFILSLLEP